MPKGRALKAGRKKQYNRVMPAELVGLIKLLAARKGMTEVGLLTSLVSAELQLLVDEPQRKRAAK